MADERRARDDERVEVTALEALVEGVHADSRRWHTIESAATSRRRRRAWRGAGAAAAVVVVLAAVGLALARQPDGTTQVAVGDLLDPTDGRGAAAPHVLPPTSATDVVVYQLGDGAYDVQYSADGTRLRLVDYGAVDLGDAPARTADLQGFVGDGDALGVIDPRLGVAVVTCSAPTLTGVDQLTSTGPAQAVFLAGGRPFALQALGPADSCVPDALPDGYAPALAALRPAGDAAWEAFLAEHPPIRDLATFGPTGSPAPTSTSSTQVPANVDPAARGEIIQAFERMDERDADGGLPYVDGEDAELMARVADAAERTQVGAPTVFAVLDIDFLTPESASVAFSSVASLPAGPVTTHHVGSAIVVDGHWQVTRETLEDLVDRAGA